MELVLPAVAVAEPPLPPPPPMDCAKIPKAFLPVVVIDFCESVSMVTLPALPPIPPAKPTLTSMLAVDFLSVKASGGSVKPTVTAELLPPPLPIL